MWVFFFFSSRRRHTRCSRDWSSDVCSSDLEQDAERLIFAPDLFGIAEASFIFVGIMILCGMLPAMVISLDRPMSVIQRDSTGVSPAIRSEEHTSELQSRLHLVCRLLLEKKKKIVQLSCRTEESEHSLRATMTANPDAHSCRNCADLPVVWPISAQFP